MSPLEASSPFGLFSVWGDGCEGGVKTGLCRNVEFCPLGVVAAYCNKWGIESVINTRYRYPQMEKDS